MRYERKFFVEAGNQDQLFPLIQLNPLSFKEAYPDRKVNSIYFDDYAFTMLQDNLDGNPERRKIRLRWYGEQHDIITGGRLEVKSKVGLTGSKQLFEFPDLPLSDMPVITTQVNELLHFDNIQPALIVRYHRAYYVSFNKHIRLTVDSQLQYTSMEGQAWETEGAILEVKYAPEKEEEVAEMMQYFPFRLSKHSKYALGMTANLI